MELDNFILKEYNKDNKLHEEVMMILCSDQATKQYLGDLRFAAQLVSKRKEEDRANGFYIAFYDEEPIGYISLTKIVDSYQISSSILPKFRGQHLAALLLEEFSEKVFEKYDYINQLDLVIKNQNIGSIKSAILADYKKEEDKYTRRRV